VKIFNDGAHRVAPRRELAHAGAALQDAQRAKGHQRHLRGEQYHALAAAQQGAREGRRAHHVQVALQQAAKARHLCGARAVRLHHARVGQRVNRARGGVLQPRRGEALVRGRDAHACLRHLQHLRQAQQQRQRQQRGVHRQQPPQRAQRHRALHQPLRPVHQQLVQRLGVRLQTRCERRRVVFGKKGKVLSQQRRKVEAAGRARARGARQPQAHVLDHEAAPFKQRKGHQAPQRRETRRPAPQVGQRRGEGQGRARGAAHRQQRRRARARQRVKQLAARARHQHVEHARSAHRQRSYQRSAREAQLPAQLAQVGEGEARPKPVLERGERGKGGGARKGRVRRAVGARRLLLLAQRLRLAEKRRVLRVRRAHAVHIFFFLFFKKAHRCSRWGTVKFPWRMSKRT
jgi:hypothetical protein